MEESKKNIWSAIVDRQTGLFSDKQNEILRETRVLALGLGGMGMNGIANLARCGFEHFTLMDFDIVDGSNSNRLPFAFDDTLDLQKVEATRRYLLKINPAIDVQVHPNVKLGLDSDIALMEKLVREHDVMSWAMDGLAGRIHYTRIAHQVGASLDGGKPAVESWALPYHFCAWTVPNKKDTPTWEEYFELPSVGVAREDVDTDLTKKSQAALFQRLASAPHLWEGIDKDLMDRWVGMKIPNRSLGHAVSGCGALIAQEIISVALEHGGEPLEKAPVHYAPWMPVYNFRRNTAYEINFHTMEIRWRHPLTGELSTQSI